MTEEEAIAYGKRVIELGLNDETQAFCELAIKALEQEPTTKNDLGVGCISRIETIDYLCKHCPDDGECFKDCDEIKHLRQMPSVTPQEPRKGHWEVVSDGYSDNAYICECSECKDTVWVYKDADRKWNYCPNCGADMREGEE